MSSTTTANNNNNSSNVIVGTLITSTTAPGKVFGSRSELAQHYKSEWHKYNLKRREANLPLLIESEFQARWEAALALRAEQQKASSMAGKAHLKKKKNKDKDKNKNEKDSKKVSQIGGGGGGGEDVSEDDEDAVGDVATKTAATTSSSSTKVHPKETPESQENPEINPLQSLFDSNVSETLEENVTYMERKYGFFVPDRGTCILEWERTCVVCVCVCV